VRLGGASSGPVVSGPPGLGSVRRSGQGEDLYWTKTPITVGNTDVQNLVVTMNQSLTLAGRLVYEGTTRTTIESVQVATGGARPPMPAQVVQPPPPKPDGRRRFTPNPPMVRRALVVPAACRIPDFRRRRE
jgi:hypothetical protein